MSNKGCLMHVVFVVPTPEDRDDGRNAEGQPLQVHLAGKTWHILKSKNSEYLM